MPLAIARFTQAHPAVELSMTLMEPEEALPAMRMGDVDLAITFGGGAPGDRESDGFEHFHLLEDPMYLVLGADHPLAAQARRPAGRPGRRGVDRRARRTASATG